MAGTHLISTIQHTAALPIAFFLTLLPTARQTWAFDYTAMFLDLPFHARETWSGLDVGIVGVPLDLGATHRPGARFSPRTSRNTERIGRYDHVLNIAPATMLNAADVGDISFRDRFNLTSSHKDIQMFITELVQAEILRFQ